MRVFLGLPLPTEVVQTLTRVTARLRTGRLVPPENLHLTLAFMGDQTLPILEDLHLGLETARLHAPDLVIIACRVYLDSSIHQAWRGSVCKA